MATNYEVVLYVNGQRVPYPCSALIDSVNGDALVAAMMYGYANAIRRGDVDLTPRAPEQFTDDYLSEFTRRLAELPALDEGSNG